ncbi:MAG: hypothetical protein MJ092_03035 [Lachnospiraceae bacterium]|nr:hypothetical protein [Lachnospiraceae bacterium]
MLGIGIDTGGTCTDAVIFDLDTKEVLGAGKAITTKTNLEIGIANALDTLPKELMDQVESLSLSTTLATNACVENKGYRAKLLIIGTTPEMMEQLTQVLSKYGINDMSQLIAIDAKAENLYEDHFDPDWDELKERIPELFSDCDSIGVVQTYPDANGGRFELTALRVLKEGVTMPVTISYDISQETDFLKVCASTLLNARLIPLIAEFMEAVHHVMEERGLDVPLTIVRSDGTLMSEEMARTCPVETLLCGPVASVIGGCVLAQEDSAILVDMGGTTTDLALVQKNNPVMAKGGIFIGQYRTSIKGLDAQAMSLGGDTAVRFKDGKLYLDSIRVIPISVLAYQYDNVLPRVQEFAKRRDKHTRWIHEFYVLQKDISGRKGYTEQEQKICEILKEKPLITQDLLEAGGWDLYHLNTERLEQEGIIIKSGLTPTDMMILKGDFDKYDGEAAKVMAKFVALCVGVQPEQLPDMVYEFVVKRMYMNIGRFILQHQYPEQREFLSMDEADVFLNCFYDQAVRDDEDRIGHTGITTPYPLIGIGAPIHVFLPRVAKYLGTRAVIPEYAQVANALGAAAANRVSRFDVRVIAKYRYGTCIGYTVVTEGEKHLIEMREEALAFGRQFALDSIKKRAIFQGLGDDPVIDLTEEEIHIKHSGVLLEIDIHAVAHSRAF